jgi:sugar/nucleoside kinase (ribokinase family)
VPDAVYDVVAVGNALVDIITHEQNSFLNDHGLVKGSMSLVDESRADKLYDAMGPGTEMSGGSAGNTMAALASFGGRAAFIGKVRDDALGKVFAHDLRAIGVAFESPMATSGPATGRCLIVVTPDAERTMSTYLGAGAHIGPEDLNGEMIGASKVTYLEGYLWDLPAAKDAYREASRIAHEAGREVALTLSDAFCVDRHRNEWVDLVEGNVDVLFGNEDEVSMLYDGPFDAAVKVLKDCTKVAAITRGARGSVIIAGDYVVEVAAEPVDRLEDTTGAGDAYAAGFLYGYTRGMSLADCGRLGSSAAAEVISHTGARPLIPLSTLLPG